MLKLKTQSHREPCPKEERFRSMSYTQTLLGFDFAQSQHDMAGQNQAGESSPTRETNSTIFRRGVELIQDGAGEPESEQARL